MAEFKVTIKFVWNSETGEFQKLVGDEEEEEDEEEEDDDICEDQQQSSCLDVRQISVLEMKEEGVFLACLQGEDAWLTQILLKDYLCFFNINVYKTSAWCRCCMSAAGIQGNPKTPVS